MRASERSGASRGAEALSADHYLRPRLIPPSRAGQPEGLSAACPPSAPGPSPSTPPQRPPLAPGPGPAAAPAAERHRPH